jgi:hypothetical protein
MAKAELPEDWEYTGRTLRKCIESIGLVGNFYYDLENKSIYTVKKVFSEPVESPLPKHKSTLLKAEVRYVNPKNPKRTMAANAPGVIFKSGNLSLVDLVEDQEVRKKSESLCY